MNTYITIVYVCCLDTFLLVSLYSKNYRDIYVWKVKLFLEKVFPLLVSLLTCLSADSDAW